eukprot:15452790-Alexandrium_andersonii.AAC.1
MRGKSSADCAQPDTQNCNPPREQQERGCTTRAMHCLTAPQLRSCPEKPHQAARPRGARHQIRQCCRLCTDGSAGQHAATVVLLRRAAQISCARCAPGMLKPGRPGAPAASRPLVWPAKGPVGSCSCWASGAARALPRSAAALTLTEAPAAPCAAVGNSRAERLPT